MFKQHCASDNILVALTPEVFRGHLGSKYDRSEIILGDVSLDALEDGLSGESIGRHIIAALIIAGENPADLAGLDFWLDCSNNFLPCLLPCQMSITTIVLEKNHLGEGLVTQTRSSTNLNARCKGLDRDFGLAKKSGGVILTFITLIFFL
jgi:hypothetical protein